MRPPAWLCRLLWGHQPTPSPVTRDAWNSGERSGWALRPHVFVPDKSSGSSDGGWEDPAHLVWTHEYEICLACGATDNVNQGAQTNAMHTRGAVDIERGGMIALPEAHGEALVLP